MVKIMRQSKVWAHRGASAYAPENTMPAFELAARMGADGVETDVHLTVDNELVLCHDDVLGRTCKGEGPIWEKSLPELRALDFSNGMPGYRDVRIPLLRELLELAKEKGLFVNIEMKYSGTRWDETNERTAALVRETGMSGQVIFSSFKADPVLRLKKLLPSKVALLYGDPLDKPWELALQKGFDALHPFYDRILEQDMPRMCRLNGILLNPWTLNDPDVLETAMRLGVDAVITNKPDLALDIRQKLSKGISPDETK